MKDKLTKIEFKFFNSECFWKFFNQD